MAPPSAVHRCKGCSASVTFTLTVEEVNDPPEFKDKAVKYTATEGTPFSYTAPKATDVAAAANLVYTAFVKEADGELASLPGWLTFDGATRMFSGIPGRDDARQTHTILVKVTDPGNLSATTTFRLRVETKYNSRLPQVAKQWRSRHRQRPDREPLCRRSRWKNRRYQQRPR